MSTTTQRQMIAPNSDEALPLHRLPVGARAQVSHLSEGNPALCQRLLSMGLVMGSEVCIKGIAPLGDPIQIETLGYKLSLRISEAAYVVVRLLSAPKTHV